MDDEEIKAIKSYNMVPKFLQWRSLKEYGNLYILRILILNESLK